LRFVRVVFKSGKERKIIGMKKEERQGNVIRKKNRKGEGK
jgi:hypothetical protein